MGLEKIGGKNSRNILAALAFFNFQGATAPEARQVHREPQHRELSKNEYEANYKTWRTFAESEAGGSPSSDFLRFTRQFSSETVIGWQQRYYNEKTELRAIDQQDRQLFWRVAEKFVRFLQQRDAVIGTKNTHDVQTELFHAYSTNVATFTISQAPEAAESFWLERAQQLLNEYYALFGSAMFILGEEISAQITSENTRNDVYERIRDMFVQRVPSPLYLSDTVRAHAQTLEQQLLKFEALPESQKTEIFLRSFLHLQEMQSDQAQR